MINTERQVDIDKATSDENNDIDNNEVLSEIGEILNRQHGENETGLDELLAIIAEISLDKKEILNKIKNVNETEGIALYGAIKDKDIAILVGNKIKVCVAKEDIEQYEIVKFITVGANNELAVVLLKTYAKDILNIIEEIDFALESGGNLDIIAAVDFALESGGNLEKIADDFATETTLGELNNKVESVTEGGISKIQIKDGVSQNIFELILIELQKINIHLSLITDNEIKDSDIE